MTPTPDSHDRMPPVVPSAAQAHPPAETAYQSLSGCLMLIVALGGALALLVVIAALLGCG
jgi:hypothetical protein